MGTALEVVEEESSAWVVAHRALSRLAKERAAADAEEGRWLLAALRSAAHVHLGFASFGEYVERCFGYKPRSTQEKLRVAEALEEPSERRHILRFEVAPETFALFREAIMALRRSSDSALDDDSALLAMARHVLGGPRDEGRASYQIALTVCTECGRGHQPSGGDLVAVGSDIVAMAHCDGQHLGCIAPREGNDSAFPDGSDSSGSVYVGADLHAGSDSVPAHVGANVHAHAEDRQANAHVGANAPPTRDRARELARAKQSIPPALRRAVVARDHRRCRVPGCRNSAFIDVHHIELRSEGGGNDAENLIVLCGAHHRAAHRGRLLVQGASATAAGFRHADGSPYGQVGEPQALDVRAKTFSALRNLGFREGEVRAVLARLRDEGELAAGTLEQWLRAALARLTR